MGQAVPLRCVFEDDDLVVVDKPAGLLAVPGRGEAGADCLSAQVQAVYPDAQIVHRLDMATSGLMVFARGTHNQRLLSQAFAARRVTKCYIAVVVGCIEGDAGEIALPLTADWPNRPRQRVDANDGKPSLTRWRVLTRDGDRSTRLELEPVTGRTHQLRVHLQAIGHAIAGDALYADATALALAPRLLLHATDLCLDHPLSGARVGWYSEPPF